tara:strand:+ start:13471 stop:13608 length:138 start_codon:yes stop_codon:yes gene_type:complete
LEELTSLSIAASIALIGIILLFFPLNQDDDDQDGGMMIPILQKTK